ncbi:hypothetical protein RUE5091_01574 [Ruegeria denitrificans]|uniref:Uncharacterized protein n=1 Tax=Ruegeria denitrificans TaxID=1715692 RepID=A0A0P1IF21_9RHOB|nr:hypothetical protein RUE5091_01574 [Ruegeria denitrificans]
MAHPVAYRILVDGLSETGTLRRYHIHRQSLRARRLNLRPPGK